MNIMAVGRELYQAKRDQMNVIAKEVGLYQAKRKQMNVKAEGVRIVSSYKGANECYVKTGENCIKLKGTK